MLVRPLLQGTEGSWGPVPSSLGEEAVPGSGKHLGVYVAAHTSRPPQETTDKEAASPQRPSLLERGSSRAQATSPPGHLAQVPRLRKHCHPCPSQLLSAANLDPPWPSTCSCHQHRNRARV